MFLRLLFPGNGEKFIHDDVGKALYSTVLCNCKRNIASYSSLSSSLKYCIVAIGNPERHIRKAWHCGSKQHYEL